MWQFRWAAPYTYIIKNKIVLESDAKKSRPLVDCPIVSILYYQVNYDFLIKSSTRNKDNKNKNDHDNKKEII